MASGPRILIAGCGAIGSVFACLLRQAKHNIAVLGRPSHIDAIAARGLHLDGIWGTHHASGFEMAITARELSGPFDLILVAVKAYDTEWMVDAVAPLIARDGIAISLQNGLGNVEILSRAFGPEKSLGANVLVGATMPEPGRITVTVQASPIIMGPLELSDCVMMEKIHAWARAFNEAKIPCETTTRVLSYLWGKVFYNAPLNALGALLDVHYGVLAEEHELKTVMNRVIDEAFRVAEKKEIDCLWESVDEYREYFYGHLVPATYDHRSSMLQDLQRGRRTEIDAINGRIWRYGEEAQVPTPYNEILTRLIWQKERPRRSEAA